MEENVMRIKVGFPDKSGIPLVIIGPTEKAAIAKALADARARPPLTKEIFEAAEGGKIDVPTITIPNGYSVGVGFEQHNKLCMHVSVALKGPSGEAEKYAAAIGMIVEEFGITENSCADVWVEDIDNSSMVVNFLMPVPTTQ